jgi:imidazolonepropionase-like amidohydrolase
VLVRHTVAVERGVIAAIGPDGAVGLDEETQVVDAAGGFLLPGLADMHTHLVMRDPDPAHLILYLAQGVTTLRSMSGTESNAAWRSLVEAGELLGPTIFTAGPTLVGGLEGEDPDLVASLPVYVPDSVDDIVAEVRRQAAGWADLVKVYDGLPEDQYLAAISTANQEGIYVAGHALDDTDLSTILTSGIDEIAHTDELNRYHWIGTPGRPDFALAYDAIPATVELMVDNDVAIVSNLVADEVLYQLIFGADEVLARPEYRTVRPETVGQWRRAGRHVERFADQGPYRRDQEMPFFLTLIRALHEAGIIITAGTDCSTLEGSVQSNIHRELELLVESGLSPYEALRAGTINASAIAGRMGKDAAFGAIAIGNRADLLLLEEDPLEDVGHTRSRLGVVVRGRWFSQEELDERVAALVASY